MNTIALFIPVLLTLFGVVSVNGVKEFSVRDAMKFLKQIDSDSFGQEKIRLVSAEKYRQELVITNLKKTIVSMLTKVNSSIVPEEIQKNIQDILTTVIEGPWNVIGELEKGKTANGVVIEREAKVEAKKSRFVLAHLTVYASLVVQKILSLRHTHEFVEAGVAENMGNFEGIEKPQTVQAPAPGIVRGIFNRLMGRKANAAQSIAEDPKEKAWEIAAYLMDVYDRLEAKTNILTNWMAKEIQEELKLIKCHNGIVKKNADISVQDIVKNINDNGCKNEAQDEKELLSKIKKNVSKYNLIIQNEQKDLQPIPSALNAPITADLDKDGAELIISVLSSPEFASMKTSYENVHTSANSPLKTFLSEKSNVVTKSGSVFEKLSKVVDQVRLRMVEVNSDLIAIGGLIDAKAVKSKSENPLPTAARNKLFVLALENLGLNVNKRLEEIFDELTPSVKLLVRQSGEVLIENIKESEAGVKQLNLEKVAENLKLHDQVVTL